MGLTEMFRHATGRVRGEGRKEPLRGLEMPAFVPAWMESVSPSDFDAVAAEPTPAGALDAWARARGILSLPPELRAFYAETDGIRCSGGWPSVQPVPALRLGRELTPALADQLEAHWLELDRELAGSRGLRVVRGGMAAARPERLLPFTDTHDMLVLNAPAPCRATLMVVMPHPRFPVGAVLDVDHLVVLRYGGLRHWLAEVAQAG